MQVRSTEAKIAMVGAMVSVTAVGGTTLAITRTHADTLRFHQTYPTPEVCNNHGRTLRDTFPRRISGWSCQPANDEDRHSLLIWYRW